MGRWLHENDYDALVQAMSASFGGRVKPELIKAIIAAESAFNAAAVRGEPQIAGASIGLMQLLYSTAKRLGYPGEVGEAATLTGLFRPDANIYIGAKYLDELLKQTGGDVDAAISAYNGGYRPELGFGALRTSKTPTVCLQWKPTAPKTGRTIARDCARIGTTMVGKFSNQQYVDRVKNYLDYFFVWVPPQPAAPSSPSGGATEPTSPSSSS
jgi:soluble lytic murein transglycosylase-like protein